MEPGHSFLHAVLRSVSDSFELPGGSCRVILSGTGDGWADVQLVSSAVCGNGVLEHGEQCDGGSCCDAACLFRSSSVVCRAVNGPCDVAEFCSGSSSTCGPNAFLPVGSLCRNASFGPCDVPDFCTLAGTCPNSFSSDGSSCALAACPSVAGTCLTRQCLGDCLPAPSASATPLVVRPCGDGLCGDGEDCLSCPQDCPRGTRYCCSYDGCAGRNCPATAAAVQSLCHNIQSAILSPICLFGQCQ
jgi:hypothetical protein